MLLLERFAFHYGLLLQKPEDSFAKLPGDSRFGYSIPGKNGFVMESDGEGELQAGIMYLSNWERLKTEFRLSYNHCRVIPAKPREWCIHATFSPDNERQARLIIELADLRPASSHPSFDKLNRQKYVAGTDASGLNVPPARSEKLQAAFQDSMRPHPGWWVLPVLGIVASFCLLAVNTVAGAICLAVASCFFGFSLMRAKRNRA
jgi:hypothetical protein